VVSLSTGSLVFASDLPACPLNQDSYWNNCFGTLTFASGTKYVGENKNDK
jgi:hypothetical protein